LTSNPSLGIHDGIDSIAVNNCPRDISAFAITCYDYLQGSKTSTSLAVQVNDCYNVYMITPVVTPTSLAKIVLPGDHQVTMSMTNVFTLDPNCDLPTVSGSSAVTCWLVNHDSCITLVGPNVVSDIDSLDIKGDLTLNFFQCPTSVSF